MSSGSTPIRHSTRQDPEGPVDEDLIVDDYENEDDSYDGREAIISDSDDGSSHRNQPTATTARPAGRTGTGTAATAAAPRPRDQHRRANPPTNLSSSSSARPRIPSSITDDNYLRFPQVGYSAVIAAEKHKRSHLREARSTALAVMMNREILTIHAIAAHESLAKTRRRFIAQMILPDDERGQKLLFADWFVNDHYNASSDSGSKYKWTGLRQGVTGAGEDERAIRREYVDVYEGGEGGWLSPSPSSTSDSKTKSKSKSKSGSGAGDLRQKGSESAGGSKSTSTKGKERRSAADSSPPPHPPPPSSSSSSRRAQGGQGLRPRRNQNDLERERQIIERTIQREAQQLYRHRLENLPRIQFELPDNAPRDDGDMELDLDDLDELDGLTADAIGFAFGPASDSEYDNDVGDEEHEESI